MQNVPHLLHHFLDIWHFRVHFLNLSDSTIDWFEHKLKKELHFKNNNNVLKINLLTLYETNYAVFNQL